MHDSGYRYLWIGVSNSLAESKKEDPSSLLTDKMLTESVTSYTQIGRSVMKFCHLTKFQRAPAYLMLLKFCKI